MRTIKFRGKVNGTCKNPDGLWIYGFPYQEDGKWEIRYDFPGGFGQGRTKINPVINETIGQYTGLKDKNGKDTYEGDIIFNDDRNEYGIIRFNNKKAMFVTEYLVSNDMFPLYETLSNLYYSVGNIYDNPELLNQ